MAAETSAAERTPVAKPSDGGAATSYLASAIYMDTMVTIEVVAGADDDCSGAVERAFGWFEEVESRCSRFDPTSELSQLSATCSEAIVVSPLLFRVIEFALAVARATGGAFDPAIGARMAERGFNTNYRTGERVAVKNAETKASYRDVVLERNAHTVTLARPLTLDLGAVAKGLAIDLAAESLRGYQNFAINAGGDLYLAGLNREGRPWDVGIRHPREDGLIETLRLSQAAVCSSGDYERSGTYGHHILDASAGESAQATISATVVAPSAMLADALATAAFVLGPERGITFLEEQGVEGMMISPGMERFETSGFARYRR